MLTRESMQGILYAKCPINEYDLYDECIAVCDSADDMGAYWNIIQELLESRIIAYDDGLYMIGEC